MFLGKKIRNLLFLGISGIAAVTGCQQAQIDYMRNPEVSVLTTEFARTQNCLNSFMKTRYKDSLNDLGKYFARTGASVASLVDDVVGITTIRPLSRDIVNIFSEDRDAWNYKQMDVIDKTQEGKSLDRAALHIPNSLMKILNSSGNVVNNLVGTTAQLANMGIVLPMTFNTKEGAELLGQDYSDLDGENDGFKKSADTITDFIKGPIKCGFYFLGNQRGMPDTWRLGWENLKTSAGYKPSPEREDLVFKLYNFEGNEKSLNVARAWRNAIPFADQPIDYFVDNTKFRQKENNWPEKIICTSQFYMRTTRENDKDWKLPSSPGEIKDVNGEYRYHPTESYTIVLGSTLSKALSLFLGGGGGGTGGGGVSGGTGGGPGGQ